MKAGKLNSNGEILGESRISAQKFSRNLTRGSMKSGRNFSARKFMKDAVK